MSDIDDDKSSLNANDIPLPPDKDAMKKAKLMQQKRSLEAEQQALQSVRTQLRSQQRNLLIENSRLQRIWKYREKVKNGEIDDPEVKYGLESVNIVDSKKF